MISDKWLLFVKPKSYVYPVRRVAYPKFPAIPIDWDGECVRMQKASQSHRAGAISPGGASCLTRVSTLLRHLFNDASDFYELRRTPHSAEY
jgi:hypothetical protein